MPNLRRALILLSSLATVFTLYGVFSSSSRSSIPLGTSFESAVGTTMASLTPLKTLVVNASAKHTATVLVVHGLGDSGHGWEPVAQMLGREKNLAHVKWIMPHAPQMAVTANGGMIMPSWFDILSFGFKGDEDENGMLRTVHLLNQIITAEVDAGIPPSRIVLGGFSQGGAMTLLTGLTTERRLAGLAVLSGWLPMSQKVKAMISEHATKLPIFWGHGTEDPIVKFEHCQRSVAFLKSELKIAEGADGLNLNIYPGMQHSTCNQELVALKAWLERRLPAEGL
ncbi:Phospholipase/Carboxylesterase-domain-containing protein [Schizophyllum amplum]|uniref:Acyl-protein thioesterase 1 n=1 Tax=Schizophyllum amplum TaxID=97359 RepID=A0A550CSW3_9AGAR|nr:Phospholipase/Carboxylesterase-domain-containing protein [Auriculariopsis ampla]